jgi:flagellar protein FliO/FliZ
MTNYSKKKAFLLAALLLAGFCVSAQASQPVDEKSIVLDQPAASGAVQTTASQSSPSSIWILLRIIIALALVGAGIYGVVYLLKKTSRMDGASDTFLKSVAALPLAPNRSLQVITAGNQAFLVGITEKSISLISELTDKELIDAMNLEASKKTPVPGGNFATLVAGLMPKAKPRTVRGDSETSGQSASGEENASGSESAVATADFLKRQRERLSGGFRDDQTGAYPERGPAGDGGFRAGERPE